jgi:hypothetical protein
MTPVSERSRLPRSYGETWGRGNLILGDCGLWHAAMTTVRFGSSHTPNRKKFVEQMYGSSDSWQNSGQACGL